MAATRFDLDNTALAKIEPKSVSVMPTADGGAVVTLDGGTRVVFTNDQTNVLLHALLAVATIKIEPES